MQAKPKWNHRKMPPIWLAYKTTNKKFGTIEMKITKNTKNISLRFGCWLSFSFK